MIPLALRKLGYFKLFLTHGIETISLFLYENPTEGGEPVEFVFKLTHFNSSSELTIKINFYYHLENCITFKRKWHLPKGDINNYFHTYNFCNRVEWLQFLTENCVKLNRKHITNCKKINIWTSIVKITEAILNYKPET